MSSLGGYLAIVAFAASAGTAWAQHVPKLSVQNYKSEIEMLLALSPEDASKQPEPGLDPKTIALKSADQLEKARSYSSIARILDKGSKELAAHHSVGIFWTFDHVEPDRYHVTQNSWGGGPGYDFDEWITIGKSEFDFYGLWMPQLETVVSKWNPLPQNRDLGLQKYLQILRTQQPGSADVYLYRAKRYCLLVYLLPAGGDYEAFLEQVSGSAKLEMWIDLESALLAKARFVPTTNPPGEKVPLEFEQVFAGYSGDVHVEAPGERCSASRNRMCFSFRTLQTAPEPAGPKSTTAPQPAQETQEMSYSNPVYNWSVSYPADWSIDSKNPEDVRISPPAQDAVCGLHSGAVRSKTVDEFTDHMQAYNDNYFREKGTSTRSSPKQPITLPNGVVGIDVTTDILSGGKSRRIYVLVDGVGYGIDCETYASKFEKLEPFFDRIIRSFSLEKKP